MRRKRGRRKGCSCWGNCSTRAAGAASCTAGRPAPATAAPGGESMALGQRSAGTEGTAGTALGRAEGTEGTGTERKACRRRQEGVGRMGRILTHRKDPYPAA